MTENLWKLIDGMEQITDHISEINDYLDKVHETNQAFSIWINEATNSIMELKKDINYIKHKKDCI